MSDARYAEAFRACADQVAGCGHVVPLGGFVVDVHEGGAFSPILRQLCGACFNEIGRAELDAGS